MFPFTQKIKQGILEPPRPSFCFPTVSDLSKIVNLKTWYLLDEDFMDVTPPAVKHLCACPVITGPPAGN